MTKMDRQNLRGADDDKPAPRQARPEQKEPSATATPKPKDPREARSGGMIDEGASGDAANVLEGGPRTSQQGGMIGEGTSGDAAAQFTEGDLRATRQGGMIDEGQ